MLTLLDSPDDQAFRAELRSFVEAELDPGTRRKVSHGEPLTRDEILAWHRALYRKGWIAPAWPKEHGGPGWSARQRMIFDEEMFCLDTPVLPGFGIKLIGPVLMRHGTEEQRARFMPGILSAEDWWCQGFSEPGSGSDLASLSTRATRTDGGWVVNGSKTWTSYAQYANWMFCLVRTDPEAKKQLGISMMLIDMTHEGVEVRPIRLMDGTVEVNSVFLNDVPVPDDCVVGEINKGWSYAKFLLGNERLGAGGIGRSKHALARARKLAGETGLADDPAIIAQLAEIEIDILSVEATTLRMLAAEENGGVIGAEPSLLKIRGTEIQQRLTGLMVEMAGPLALPRMPEDERANDLPVPEALRHVAYQHMNWRKLSIYGGSNQIQRQILASQILGL